MRKINRIVSTVCGIGYLPFAPGTFGAAFAVVIWYFLVISDPINQILAVFLATAIGIYSSGKVSMESGKDPSFVVIDELAGMWISLLFIPHSIINYTVAFILFRFFDILKPLGIKWMEKGKNGWGIMLDDVLAGIYSNIALQLLIVLNLW
jgi:phosphatidylglycerophosphatase A